MISRSHPCKMSGLRYECFGLHVIPLNSQNQPWHELVDCHSHFKNQGQIAITLSNGLEMVSLYYKDEQYKKVVTNFIDSLPQSLLDKLIIIEANTVESLSMNMFMLLYRCPEADLPDADDIFLLGDTNGIRIYATTKAKGSFVFNSYEYEVVRGRFNLSTLDIAIPEISSLEREQIFKQGCNMDMLLPL